MEKRTTIALAEFIAEATGFSESNMRSYQRRIRESGRLSQFGRGPGAAAATPKDAAMLLLVAMTQVPPLHCVAVAEVLLACVPKEFEKGPVYTTPILECPAANIVDHVAQIIANGAYVGGVTLGSNDEYFAAWITSAAENGGSWDYEVPERARVLKLLSQALGTARRLRTERGMPGEVLLDIGEYLGIERAAGQAA